jgi:hypothetical protein
MKLVQALICTISDQYFKFSILLELMFVLHLSAVFQGKGWLMDERELLLG